MQLNKLLITCALFAFTANTSLQAQKMAKPAEKATNLIQSGPMVGYSEMREVGLWVQTTQPANVKISYKADSSDVWLETATVSTDTDFGNTAKLIADKVMPGKKYTYKVLVNGRPQTFNYPLRFQSQSLWQWRTDPPTVNFAIGSCNYVSEPEFDRPGKPYGSGYEIFNSIYNAKPDFMLWLGDNTYLREPDWNTKTGFIHRYTHTRSLAQMQPLLASSHHFAMWDDHDFGPNDSDRGFWNKNLAQDVFNRFWVNPNTNLTGQGGITGRFRWSDADFYMLDDRWFRAPDKDKNPDKPYLGQAQINWLMDNLISSNAAFKFICIGNQVINPTENEPENYSAYRTERAALLKAITDAKITGIIFLSGDRHHTELCKLDREGTYPLYDLTCSALTSGAHIGGPNVSLVPGTLFNDHNFGMLEISGKNKARKLTISIRDIAGKEVWNKIIKEEELK